MIQYVTTTQAADILKAAGFSTDRSTIWRWAQKHPALGVRLGSTTMFNRRTIESIADGVPIDQAASQ